MNKINLMTKFVNMIYKISISSNDPFIDYFSNKFRCVSNFSVFKKVFEIENIKLVQHIYFNKTCIHKILYESEKVIEIKVEYVNCISDFFYVDLLIKDDSTIINYVYSLIVIEKINGFIDEKNLPIKNIILAKISLEFIYNYKQTDKYVCKIDKDKLTLIEDKNKKIINENINGLRELNNSYNDLKVILSEGIDIIYIDIFIGLIQKGKISDFEFTFNIMKQLDFESLYINNNMIKELYKAFDKDFFKPYIIKNIEEIFDMKKANFYYFLLKYILKDPLFIYQIPFLFKIHLLIINNIKNNNMDNIWKLFENEEGAKKERIIYIIRTMTDSEYYNVLFLNHRKNLDEINEILIYYEKFLFQSKKKEIYYISNYIKNNSKSKKDKKIIYNILKDYKKAKYLNKRFPIINYMFGIESSNLSEYQINKFAYEWDILEIMLKRRKYKKFRKDTTEKLLNYFQEENNKTILLNIFKEEDFQYFINEKINLANKEDDEENIKITLQNDDIDNQIIEIRDISTSNLKSIKKTETSVIRESYYIQSEDISNISYTNDKNAQNEKELEDNSFINESFYIVKEVEKELFAILLKSSKYKILEYVKPIGQYKRPQFVKILSNDYILVSGEDKKLYIYDFLYNHIMDIKINSEKYPYDITENIYKEDNKYTELIISSMENILYINLDIKNKDCRFSKYESETISSLSLLIVDKNKTVISGLKGIIYIENLFVNDKAIYHKQKYKIPYTQGIIINEKLIALTSNSIIPKGQNKIVFYNWKKNAIFHEIKGFSFSFSSNGLCLINSDKTNSDSKILLCACREYDKGTKNGILVIGMDLKNEEFYHCFYETKNFEVFCFCQLSIIKNENPIYEDISNKKNIKVINTRYVLIGGFDKNRNEGLIKLYRIANNRTIKNTKIEFLQNIKIEEKNGFSGFGGPISSMTQSNIIGNIIITCWDGNVHLLNPPNIDYFLSNDK